MTDDLEGQVTDRLRKVVDPELGLNVVDLGLIQDVAFDSASGTLQIAMTLTTRGCPLEGYMLGGVRNALSDILGVKTVAVNLVWDPPWSPDRIKPAGQAQLKIRGGGT